MTVVVKFCKQSYYITGLIQDPTGRATAANWIALAYSDIMIAMPDSVRRPSSRFLFRHETAAIVIELRPEHGVLLPETGNTLL